MNRAEFLATKSRKIEERQQQVLSQFAMANAELREEASKMVEARSVYESNALEFAGLSLDETRVAIEETGPGLDHLANHIADLSVKGDPHLIEVLGLYGASQFAELLAQEFKETGAPLREIDIRDLHKLTLPSERFAGGYKEVEVEIAGSELQTSGVIDVQAHMRGLVEWSNSTAAMPALAAAVAHSWLAMIHPFEDGNGRVARLLANVVLMKAGWPPLIVRKSDRLQYLDALTHSDEGGDLLPLFDLFVKSIGRSLKELEDPKLAVRLFNEDLRKNPDKRYELWKGQVEEFIGEVRSQLQHSGWDVQRVDLPTGSEFILLSQRDPSGNTWFAKLDGPTGESFLLWFGYASNEMHDYITDAFGWPSIWISERDRREEAVHPYRPPWEWTRIGIEEVSIGSPTWPSPAFVRSRSYIAERSVHLAASMVVDAVLDVAGDQRSVPEWVGPRKGV